MSEPCSIKNNFINTYAVLLFSSTNGWLIKILSSIAAALSEGVG